MISHGKQILEAREGIKQDRLFMQIGTAMVIVAFIGFALCVAFNIPLTGV